MNGDILDRATRALRETSEAPNLRAGETRARLLSSAERKYRPRRLSVLRWAVVCTALLAGGTAMAARFSGGWSQLVRAITEASWSPPPARSAKPARTAHKAAPSVSLPHATDAGAREDSRQPTPSSSPPQPSDAAGREDSGPLPTPAPAPTPARRRREPLKPKRRVPALPAAPTAPQPIEPVTASIESAPSEQVSHRPTAAEAERAAAQLRLFRRADRLQRARDPNALQAWDAYLRAAPNGALAPEARYNRALCLIRRGQLDAARVALEPFARGDEGGYRQREARALLQRMTR